MWLLSFYRLYVSALIGTGTVLLFGLAWWFGLLTAVTVRVLWAVAEIIAGRISVNRSFARHASLFKQQLGPYGIRMINRAETDASVKKSLAEVFTGNEKNLRKAVETLEMMDTLFRAGMRPDGDAYQLHDLKLKYGKWRLEQLAASSGNT
jgi:hypothetical protein